MQNRTFVRILILPDYRKAIFTHMILLQMQSMRVKFVKAVGLIIAIAITNFIFAEGTPQVSPANNANGVSLLISPELGMGFYRNAPSNKRIGLTVLNNNGQADNTKGDAVFDWDTDGVPDIIDPDPDPCLSVLDIPDGFTPNGDGTNEFFVITGIERFPGNELIIYNRWGNVVYTAKDYKNDWDGRTNSSLTIGGNDLLPTATYYCLFDTKDENFGVAKGFIYIQR